MNEIRYVTGNSYKFATVARYLECCAPEIKLISASGYDLDEIQNSDQRIVALDKARKAWNLIKKPLLVDDDGIYFEKYHDFPGVFTKYIYEGLGVDGLYTLVEQGDAATCKVTMVYWYGPEQYELFEGVCRGMINVKPDYTADPGDPMFIPEGSIKSCAELYASGEWAQYDYRIDALKKFLAWYNNNKKNVF